MNLEILSEVPQTRHHFSLNQKRYRVVESRDAGLVGRAKEVYVYNDVVELDILDLSEKYTRRQPLIFLPQLQVLGHIVVVLGVKGSIETKSLTPSTAKINFTLNK